MLSKKFLEKLERIFLNKDWYLSWCLKSEQQMHQVEKRRIACVEEQKLSQLLVVRMCMQASVYAAQNWGRKETKAEFYNKQG